MSEQQPTVRTARANHKPREQAAVIDWSAEFPEQLALIGMEIAEELRRLAVEPRRANV